MAMKLNVFAVALAALALANSSVLAANDVATPMASVIDLLKKMKIKVDTDAKAEQASYDKLSCWCEETLSEKAEEITKGKDKIEELQTRVVKNKAFVASNGAAIGKLKKDRASNIQAQKESEEIRVKENNAYEEARQESEQCIGALESAIKMLSGAGAGKGGFLETLKEAQLLSVVAGIRRVVRHPTVQQSITSMDLQTVQRFLQEPSTFVKPSKLSALQHNPFGDYAPQSTQIQGILKSMYDSFTSDLENDNAAEAEAQKSFEELMATKRTELKELESSLQSSLKDQADKSKAVADDATMCDDTKELLDANDAFFKESKTMCAEKAAQWASRSSLRTEELAGIQQAIEVLSDGGKKLAGKTAATSFLQISVSAAMRSKAYTHLKTLATRQHSLQLAQLAVSVKTGGHFDQVMVTIDKMIGLLREEEAEDIAHRDRCEAKQNANKNALEDADYFITKSADEISRLDQSVKDKLEEIKNIEAELEKTGKSMDEMKKMRNEQREDFKQSVADSEMAVDLLDKAMNALAKFYETRGRALLQVPAVTKTVAAKIAATKTASLPAAGNTKAAAKPALEASVAPLSATVNAKAAAKPAPEASAAPSSATVNAKAAAKPAPKASVAPLSATVNAKVVAKPAPKESVAPVSATVYAKAAAKPAPETSVAPLSAIVNAKVAAKPAPKTSWEEEGGNYGGAKSTATGILAMLEMIKEDVQKEIRGLREAEAHDLSEFEEDYAVLTASYQASDKSRTKAKMEKAELQVKMSGTKQFKEAKEKDYSNEEALKVAINTDCSWVKASFQKRADARKKEIGGLTEAKEFLAGVDAPDDFGLE